MSLVVADIHATGVSLVADTKITYRDDPSRTTRDIYTGLPKLALLRDDLCVGLAGDDPAGTLEMLMANRHLPVDGLVEVLRPRRHAAHLIASLEGPQLITVRDGVIDDRTHIGRAWIGDRAGFEVFQEQAAKWPADMEPGFILLSSMQFLTTFNVVPSIGGYHTRVATSVEGFRFVADQSRIGPERMTAVASAGDRGLQLALSVPHGGDASWMSILCAPGRAPTPGALAYLVPEARHGVVYPHPTPWLPRRVRADSIDQLVEIAARDLDQHLRG